MVFLPELYEYFGLTTNGGGSPQDLVFFHILLLDKTQVVTSLNFFLPEKKNTAHLDQWKPWYFDAHFFCVSPMVNLLWTCRALIQNQGLSHHEVQGWVTTDHFWHCKVAGVVMAYSQVDCTIIQIELKTSKQIFRCRHGCIEQWILLCQLGWLRKTWSEMDANGGFLWRQSFHVFFDWWNADLTCHALSVSCCFWSVKFEISPSTSRRTKSEEWWWYTGNHHVLVSISTQSAFSMLLHKIWSAILNINAYKSMNNQNFHQQKTCTNDLCAAQSYWPKGLCFDLGRYGYGLEHLTWPTSWHVEQILSSQASWRLREEDEDKHRLLAKLRNPQTKRLACGVVTMLRCWWKCLSSQKSSWGCEVPRLVHLIHQFFVLAYLLKQHHRLSFITYFIWGRSVRTFKQALQYVRMIEKLVAWSICFSWSAWQLTAFCTPKVPMIRAFPRRNWLRMWKTSLSWLATWKRW